jgi:malate/lactate dehydrogenase
MPARIAIVGGGGGVGSSLAFNLLLREEPYEIGLVDGHSGVARSHEMDLQQVIAAGASGSIAVVGADAIADADLVVVTASAPLTENRSRMVYLHDNAWILDSVTAALRPAATVLVVTNPVDPLCTWLQRRRGLDRRRVIGYTINDSLRLRTAVGDVLGVDSRAVEAWVIGEHGDACVPLLDRVRVDGAPVALSGEQQRAATEFVRTWYIRHVALDSSRSSTWTSGHMLARMAAALLAPPTDDLWAASVVLAGEYGIDGVALTVPVTLGDGGVTQIHEWPLTDAQAAGMQAGATVVGDALAGFAPRANTRKGTRPPGPVFPDVA